MKYDEELIPKGDYCYHRDAENKAIRCPFWSLAPNRERQDNGCCSYLGIGPEDREPECENGTDRMFLWDSLKICGIND